MSCGSARIIFVGRGFNRDTKVKPMRVLTTEGKLRLTIYARAAELPASKTFR